MGKEISRRAFLKTGTAAAVGLSVAPDMLAKKKKKDVVDDPEKAKLSLRESGVIVKTAPVIALPIDDTPGGLAKMLKSVTEAGVNVEYMYAFLGRTEGKALMVLKADDEAKAEKALLASGMELASPDLI